MPWAPWCSALWWPRCLLAVSDTLGCLLFPSGVYFFPFIFTEMAGSLVFALFLYRARVTATRVILSRFCVDFFVNIVMTSPIMAWYYHVVFNKSYALFQLPDFLRIWLCFPWNRCFADPLPNGDDSLAYRMHLEYDTGDRLLLKKRQAIPSGRPLPLRSWLCGWIFRLRLQLQ